MASTHKKDSSWPHHSETGGKRKTHSPASSSQNRKTEFEPGFDGFSTEDDFYDDENVRHNPRSSAADLSYKNEPTQTVTMRIPTRIVGNVDRAAAQLNANGQETNRTQLVIELLDVPSQLLARMIVKAKR